MYEHINRCAAQLMGTVEQTQGALQTAYGTAGPSGVYVALRVTLYEVPVAWLHHAMLVTLLVLVDPTAPREALPSLGAIGTYTYILSHMCTLFCGCGLMIGAH